MSTTTAVLSMLHEEGSGSAQRQFRGDPVLRWTLDRLSRAQQLSGIAILCWEDQYAAVEPLAEEYDVAILAKGPRVRIQEIESVSASRRWADGWRGGLLQTCDFDLGFYAPWIAELFDATQSDALLLIDPSAGLVDPQLVDAIASHADSKPDQELCFSQAAPGLCGAVIRRPLVDRLTAARSHPGRTLHYAPEQPIRDPISSEACCEVPTLIARTTRNFRLDSDRQIARLTEAFVTLNGQLISSGAEELVLRLCDRRGIDPLPREIVVELNTNRLSAPIYRSGMRVRREPMSKATARRLLDEVSLADDIRLTLAGCGDPVESDLLFDFLAMARERGIRAVHIETDLLSEPVERMARLAEAPADVISFHIPAMSAATYTKVMGVDLFAHALRNIAALAQARFAKGAGVPLLVPTFVKCPHNLAEMESWYDQWTRALGGAVITGPSDFAGQIPDTSVADMSPPRRTACSRLESKMTVLSDGTVVACEQDVLAIKPIGRIGEETIERIWVERMQELRACHRRGEWGAHPLCGACREWHRP
jgi:spiro-SPASM protein